MLADNEAVYDVPEGSSAGTEIVALPSSGPVIPDQRGNGRWLRVTWHGEDVVVLSLWRDSGCVGTMRVEREQVPALVNALVEGLAEH